MKNPLLWAGMAIVIGLGGAGVALYMLKPLDKPLTAPGSQNVVSADLGKAQRDLTAPPEMILIGSPQKKRVLHLVLGDDREADKQAYDMAMRAMAQTPELTVNVVPAMTAQTPLYKAFSWAVALGNDPRARIFVDSIMGTSGALTTPVLDVIAQNNGFNAVMLKRRVESNAVKQSMEQAQDVLPPGLPAIQIEGEWLAGDTLNERTLQEKLGQVQSEMAQEENPMLVISDSYAFATAPTAKMGAMFMTLRNAGQKPVKIMGASSPVAGRVEMHDNMVDADGVMQMRLVPFIEIKAGETLTLKPAGLHLMLLDLPGPLVVGQRAPLSLQLEGGSEISTLVTVTPPGEVLTDTPHSE